MTHEPPARHRAGDPHGRRRGGSGPVVSSRIPLAILTAPFQFAVALSSIGIAAAVLVMALGGSATALPFALVLVWTGLFLSGGIAVAVGMLLRDHPHHDRRGRIAEATGLVGLGTGWAVYAVGVAAGSGTVGPIIVGPLVAGAVIVRLRAINLATRVVRSTAATHAETR